MRKNRIKIAIITWVSIIAISCNNANKSTFTKDNLVQFDTLIVNNKHHLRNDAANPSCELNVQLVFPIESRKTDLKKLQQLFIQSTLGQMYEDLTPYEAVDQYV